MRAWIAIGRGQGGREQAMSLGGFGSWCSVVLLICVEIFSGQIFDLKRVDSGVEDKRCVHLCCRNQKSGLSEVLRLPVNIC